MFIENKHCLDKGEEITLSQKVDFAQFTFDILDVVVDTTTSIGLNATGTRDSSLKEVDLAYQGVDVSLNINKHNWSDWETVNPATCVKDGLEKRTCSLCNKVETKVLPKTGVHFYGDWVVDKESTCTKEGLKHKTCSVCGDTVTETVPALGHDYHSHREEATCTKDGYVVEICSRCGDEINRAVLPANGHGYGVWVVDEEPTCTEKGSRHRVCVVCGDTEREEIAPLGHDLVHHDSKPATCTEKGFETYDTCSRCGYSTYHEIPAKGHSYGDWIVDEDPTCTEKGGRHRVCAVCGDTEREEIAPFGHALIHHDAKAPTCTESGYDAYDTCTRCGYSTYHEIPAKGHSYGDWIVDKEPTTDEEGEMSRKCSSCGDVEKQSMPKLVKSNTGLFVTIGVISGVGVMSLASLLVFLIRRKRK